MAFSTQKDFFNVPFMNETVEDECARACVQLKSYASTIDDRAWALDETNRSRFLTDLVTCRTPVEAGRGRGRDGERGRRYPSETMRVNPADSLIDATNVTLDKVQGLLQEKQALQQKLHTSEENLRTAQAEYEKVRDILNRKYDRNEFKEFYNKLQQLSSCGKFTKNDENDFRQFFKRMEDLGKAFEVSQAENSYLKRLLEKLSRRAEMDKIPIEEEKCTDVPYLQDQVNKLRKELMALRKMEDTKMYGSCGGDDPNLDATTIQTIIKERNALRDRLKAMHDIQKQVGNLRKSLCEANQVTQNLSSNLNHNSKYINCLENDMRDMQSHYEKIEQDRCDSMDCLKRKLNECQKALCQAKQEAQKVCCMQQCIKKLEENLKQRDRRLCEYDTQFKQLMCVVNEFRLLKKYLNPISKQESHTQTANNQEYMEDLLFYTSATLNEIIKEVEGRGGLTVKIEDSGICLNHTDDDKTELNLNKYNICCKEVQRLREVINRLLSEKASLSLSIQQETTTIVANVTAIGSETDQSNL